MKMKHTGNWALGLTTILAGMAAFQLTGCDPVPRRTLSVEEKTADLYWVYSQFGENYAPLKYKESRYGFNFDTLKAQYLTDAKSTKTNEEFYSLMFKFVSEFKDAHTAASLSNSGLPERAKVAFLGFSGSRTEDSLYVKGLLPTISSESDYPIKKGDKILEINGRKLTDVIKQDLVKYRDLGNEQSNFTYHMNKIFTRVSTANGLPAEKDAVLTVQRDGKKLTVTLPWVTKDLVQFQTEQEAAQKESDAHAGSAANERSHSAGSSSARTENFIMFANDLTSSILKFNFIGFDGRIELPFDNLQKITAGLNRKISDSFKFMDSFAEWNLVASDRAPSRNGTQADNPLSELEKVRAIMDDAVPVVGSTTYPAYVSPQDELDSAGKKTGKKVMVGYIYLDTFSPDGDETSVIKEFKATLKTFANLGVENIIIDTINNGGGSLVLGMELAQALTNTKIEMPKIQFRLSDSWIDQFQKSSLQTGDEASAEYSRRMYSDFVSDRSAGKWLSEPYSAEVLSPFAFNPNTKVTKNFKIKLLVNEMCASMCDIFAGILQDNKMAQVIGTRSMGAGGNVVNHNQAPNSHMDVRQTESLMLRKDGSYIENNGVTPDVDVAVVNSSTSGYDEVIQTAVDLIVSP